MKILAMLAVAKCIISGGASSCEPVSVAAQTEASGGASAQAVLTVDTTPFYLMEGELDVIVSKFQAMVIYVR